jgi:hypothetical protein
MWRLGGVELFLEFQILLYPHFANSETIASY